MTGQVIAVARDAEHRFSKEPCDFITLLPGLGVAGDAHCGRTVQHRSRRTTPQAPNLRQVHLIHAELFVELAAAGFEVGPGVLGENLTTRGIDLLSLPTGTQLLVGGEAVVGLTGLRNPCHQIDDNIARGAMAAVLDRAADGTLIRKVGVMAIVLQGGEVRPGDTIAIQFLPKELSPLVPV
ncbi:MOSC domain-containing protein [Altererythrobacter sp. Root672]|uniref:MOSC domain-containing protein n=1 Tax=Altererythrobacter sp. Root672 TaxID=1736584 RepID=UPI0006FD9674|nr:MOSC domain-containing protein [Altererythrobacter sp. Root672]KRA83443.1 molybdenum cofactor biosysynthesis protein [Altererythrobacter sp. Root672]